MQISLQIAKHFREVIFGGNWTSVSLKDQLQDITMTEATTQLQELNTIALLVFHIDYYFDAVLKVLKEAPLDAHDKFSFALRTLETHEDWRWLTNKTLNDAENLAELIDTFPENRLGDDFTDPKYGSYYRNFHGIIEHTHYHLGQIVIIKKLIRQS